MQPAELDFKQVAQLFVATEDYSLLTTHAKTIIHEVGLRKQKDVANELGLQPAVFSTILKILRAAKVVGIHDNN